MGSMTFETFETILDKTQEGVALLRKNDMRILYQNKKFHELQILDQFEFTQFLKESHTKEHLDIRADGKNISCHFLSHGDYALVILHDKTEVTDLEISNVEIKQLNEELQSTYKQYEEGTIFITDEKGNFEFVTNMIKDDCGLSPNEVIGKIASELESDKGFSPSVTKKILDSGKSQVVVQKTKPEKYFVTMGEAVKNNNGLIQKTVSVSYDFSKQVKIGNLMSQAQIITVDKTSEDDISTNIVTCSDNMLNILTLAELVATADSTVLISGETGTGKEMLAEYIHSKSKRAQHPFVRVNCGAISRNIAESELFGYEGGSFTGAKKEGRKGLFEAADGGTVFLDEIGYLPPDQQTKLLNVLQDKIIVKVGGTEAKDVEVRVIAASNIDLEDQVKKGNFRKDLFYRINVVPIDIPPLRERKDDIPLLIKHFFNIYNKKYGLEKWIEKDAFDVLCSFSWPGNIRELENMIERLIVTTKESLIKTYNLPTSILTNSHSKEDPIQINRIAPMKNTLEAVRYNLIKKAMEKYDSNKKVAEVLGIHPSTVSRKLKNYKNNNL